jgi:amino acid transporter
MKNWFLKYEQIILFYLLIIYMVLFTVFFDNQLKTTNWAGIVWVIQFFGFSTLLGLRSVKKGWVWPQRP